MSVFELIPNIRDRIQKNLSDSTLCALIAFDGDGTTFRQDRNRSCWEINPAINIIENVITVSRKGHYQLLTSARQCEEIARSAFSVIPNIGFQGNDGIVTIFGGERFESHTPPNWSTVHKVLEERFGSNRGIQTIGMEHFYGCQMWDTHPRFQEAEKLLPCLIPLIENRSGRDFTAVASPEGLYLVPVEKPGKHQGYFDFALRLPCEIGLYIVCGNGKNDREMLSAVGDLENGISFWVGAAEKKPPGTNVFAVPNEDALSAILGELGVLLPDRSVVP